MNNMIKDFESFVNGEVNEGFVDNLAAAIDAGIQNFKLNRNSDKEAEAEMNRLMNGNKDVNPRMKMQTLVRLLVEESVSLARGYSWEKLFDKENRSAEGGIDHLKRYIRHIENIIPEIKNILDGVESGDYDENEHLRGRKYQR
jgi:hypothetical protein